MPPRTGPHTTRARAGLALVALAASFVVASAPARAADAIEPPSSIVTLLSPQHPRVLATTATFAAVRQRLASDARLQGWFAKVRGDAEAVLPTSPSTYQKNPSLLPVSREVRRRVLVLATAYRLTDDTRYAGRAAQELVAAAGFPDWNPAHFLDVGEMTAAVGIGYDWLYDYLTTSQRTTIRDAIRTKGLAPALTEYPKTNSNFTGKHNWNLVCNAVALGALAIGDEDAATADQVLRYSVTSIQRGISEYAPDGGYAEAPNYWGYGTDYLVSYLAAFQTAVGTDFGLSDLPGLSVTGDFAIHINGPRGLTFNYGDGGATFYSALTGGPQVPAMMWLAQRYQRPEWAAWEALRADRAATPLDMLWYDAAHIGDSTHPAPTDAYFRHVEVATARGAWDDPNALFVATKGLRAGYDEVVGHENLDAGDLVLDAGGVRWFEELGADDYALPGYFDWRKSVGGRWDYYVTRAEGQNTMQLGSGPDPATALTNGARITAVSSTPQQWYAVTDLTGMYGGRVQRAQRGVKLFDDRRQVLLQDEVSSSEPVDYWSFLHTRTDVVVAEDGRSATLYRGEEQLWVQLLAPAGARILVGDAIPLPGSPDPAGQNRQAGSRTLVVHQPAVTTTTVSLRMVPLSEGSPPPPAAPAVTPLAAWAPGPADPMALTGIVVGTDRLVGFDPHRYRYDVTLGTDATSAPPVSAAGDDGTQAVVTQAAGVPGTATVATYRLDGDGNRIDGPTYHVRFRTPGKTARSLPIASVSASADDGNVAANTIDADMSTRWSAGGDGQHLTYDLGTARDLGAVNIAFYNGHLRRSTFDVLTSADGSIWHTALAGALSSGVTDNTEVFGFTPATGRYLRIVGHGNSLNSYNSILEVRVYRDVADAQADAPPRPVVLSTVAVTPAAPPALSIRQTLQLTLAGTRTDGGGAELSNASVTWSSSQPSVATVSASGLATAQGAGTTKIAALVILAPVLKVVRVPVTVVNPVRLSPSADATVRNGAYANVNYGSSTMLEVRNNPSLNSGYDRVSYLAFDLSAIRGNVVSATLRVYGGIDDGTATSVVDAVYTVENKAWTETSLTWNTRPRLENWLGDLNLRDTAAWHTVDLTAFVRAQLAGGQPITIGISQKVATYGPHTAFNSKEAATNLPYLELTLS